MMLTLEKKIEDESVFRVRNEEDTRKYFENKILSIGEKMKTEEKFSLEREKRLM
jgi:hypothetical protein